MVGNQLKLKANDFKQPVVVAFIALTSLLLVVGSIIAMQQFLVVSKELASHIHIIPGQEFLIEFLGQGRRGQGFLGWSALIGGVVILRSRNKNRQFISWVLFILSFLAFQGPLAILNNLAETGTLIGFATWMYCNFIQVWPFIARVFYGNTVEFWSTAVLASYVVEFGLNYMRFPWYQPDMFWLHLNTGAWSHHYLLIMNIIFTAWVGAFETFFRASVLAILKVTRSAKSVAVKSQNLNPAKSQSSPPSPGNRPGGPIPGPTNNHGVMM